MTYEQLLIEVGKRVGISETSFLEGASAALRGTYDVDYVDVSVETANVITVELQLLDVDSLPLKTPGVGVACSLVYFSTTADGLSPTAPSGDWAAQSPAAKIGAGLVADSNGGAKIDVTHVGVADMHLVTCLFIGTIVVSPKLSFT